MDELIKTIEQIAKSGLAQDKALLVLCEAIIKRVTDLEKQVDTMHEMIDIMRDIQRVHTDTMTSMRQILKAYTDKRTM